MKPDFCEDRADWLVDAIACATQDRQFLRGDMDANSTVIEAVYLNGLKALRAAYAAGLERAAEIAMGSNLVVGSTRIGAHIAATIRSEKEMTNE